MSDGKRSWAESAARKGSGQPFDPFKDNHSGWHAGPPPVRGGGSGGGGGCFVLTAAYGDPQHPMVQSLRGLRDDILVNFKLGRVFTLWYGRYGPALAGIIEARGSWSTRQSPCLRRSLFQLDC